MMENDRILLVGDQAQRVERIAGYLTSAGFTPRSTFDPETGLLLVEPFRPHVLLLNFFTVELARTYCLRLPRDRRWMQVILLCTLQEAGPAGQLVIDKRIDDYFIIKPLSDIHRLYLRIHRALDEAMRIERASYIRGQAGPTAMPEMAPVPVNPMNHFPIESGEKPATSAQKHETRAAQRDKTAPHTILVVEDDPKSMKLLSTILELAGYTVCQAQDGQQAVAQVSQQIPDLILMDIMLPDVNGIELTQRFKTDPQFEHIPIVMVSANATKDNAVLSASLGASDFIVKPIRHNVVLEKVRRWLLQA